ncbi:nuclear transport factor 2 family protein [Streptomyces sp. G9]|uniref:nuclear transport factor 2 family protein n=1 Tax=Streptomyces sp. G9 TaxID=1684483 RepID=UPI003D722658
MAESGGEQTPGPPPDGGTADVDHTRLTAIVDDWAAAIVANDADRIGSFMADEWVIVSESGITDREAFLGYVRSGDLTHSAMGAVAPPRVRVHGDTAVLTARITNTAHYGGQRFDADEWTTDVFVRRDGHWRCVLSHITPAAPPAGS